jgi:hypothetical protein
MNDEYDISLQKGNFQNNIPELPKLNTYRYENIFKVYQTNYKQFYYNILNTVQFDLNLNPSVYYEISVSQRLPWSMISFNEYETMDLWWLICIVNGINNPIELPSINQSVKIIRKEFLKFIIDEIRLKLNS